MKTQDPKSNLTERQGWFAGNKHRRGVRALERQLEYQEKKAALIRGGEEALLLKAAVRTSKLRARLEKIKPISADLRLLEVGSGAHGIVFGFENNYRVGIDPLAVDYKRLFPLLQSNAKTIAAIGEELPFSDEAFDVVLSDNVIDHAADPLKIIKEMTRVLKPAGLLYFTVNVHHPIYEIASKAHGVWNALGLRLEIAPFADHTVHLTDDKIRTAFADLPVRVIEENSSVEAIRNSGTQTFKKRLKARFFKNAVIEIIAVRD